jgi:hypothetical protein
MDLPANVSAVASAEAEGGCRGWDSMTSATFWNAKLEGDQSLKPNVTSELPEIVDTYCLPSTR